MNHSSAHGYTDNELIAIWMGYTFGKNADKNGLLKYDTSWDWLMPAYRKFKDCLIEMHKSMPPHSATKGDLIEVDIHCAITEVDIVRAHKYLVEGIKWYNNQQSK